MRREVHRPPSTGRPHGLARVPAPVRGVAWCSLVLWVAVRFDVRSWLEAILPGAVERTELSLLLPVVPIGVSVLLAWAWNDAVRSRRRATRDGARYDPLTGLATRVLLNERLHEALQRSRRNGRRVGVLFLDVDKFKAVNDTYGHETGDRLLVNVTRRLQEVVRSGDLLARLGGDEFVMVCEELGAAQEAEAIAERLQLAFSLPFFVTDDLELAVTTSIGIAMADGQATPATLLREADAAMYRAKAEGRARSATFDPSMRAALVRKAETERRLRSALDQHEYVLHYQPVVSVTDGEVMGVEALIRWHDPQRGWVAPGEFVPLLEESGLIVPVGTWVLSEACRQARSWCDVRPEQPLSVAVNVSTRQLTQPGFAELVTGVLEETGLDPTLLCLEITEAALMEDVVSAWHSLRQVKALGVRLAIDDFGTGYSSLSFVKSFALDILKIDQSFVRGLSESPEDAAIAAAVCSMAQALGLETVAEGVETPRQLDILRSLGCDLAQGYYFTRPQPPEVIDEFLATRAAERRLVARAPHLPDWSAR